MVTDTGSSLTGLADAQETEVSSGVEPKAPDTTQETEQIDESKLDYKTLYQQEQEKGKKLGADLQTERGRVRAQDRMPAWAEELRREQRAVRNRLDLMPDLIEGNAADPQAPRRRLQEMTAEEQRTAALERDVKRTGVWSQRVQSKAEKVEVDLLTDARTRQAAIAWNAAQRRGDVNGIEDAYNDLTDVLDGITEETREQRQNGAAREQVNARRQSGALRTDSGRTGGGGAASDQDLVNRFARGEDMTADDMAKASAALNKGILPKTSK